jgi:hypothetical protein
LINETFKTEREYCAQERKRNTSSLIATAANLFCDIGQLKFALIEVY